ncbi:MAG TPA: PAS domain-containing protein [Deltaproteobacteria bacterium]|nr:PAS domain-containing protein [Deltaproteobacteria bacterium]HOI08151.1 PAS domain-containing protein [Deltaproteobacteria bacterium]
MSEKALQEGAARRIRELQAENERLHHRQDTIRAVLDAQTDLFILIDRSGTVLDANQAVSNYLGVSPEDFMGTCIWGHLHPRTTERWRNMTEGVFSSGEPLRFEENEGDAWYDIVFFPVLGAGKEAGEIAILAHDITSHKQVADLLRFQRDLGLILSFSLGFREMLSRILEEVIRIRGIDAGGIYIVNEHTGDVELIVHTGLPSELPRLFAKFDAGTTVAKLIMEGSPRYWTCQELLEKAPLHMKTGRFRSATIIPIKSQGLVIATLSLVSREFDEIPVNARIALETVADRIGTVIKRTKAEELLHKYELIISTVHNPMCFVDRNYLYQAVNNAYVTAFGRTRKDFIGRSVSDIYGSDVFSLKVKKHLDKALQGEEEHYEEWFDYPGLGRRFSLQSYYPFFERDGSVSGVAAISRDITDQKAREEESIRMSKLESISTLAGGIAHDFNNLLATILGNVELAQFQVSTDHPAHKRLTKAIEACNRSRDLIRQFLALSKGGVPDKKAGPLVPLIMDSAKLALFGTHIKRSYDIPDDLWLVEYDENQIMHALHNIVRNAADAMPGGGSIAITARNVLIEHEGEGRTGIVKPGPYVLIDIQDSGPGIPEEIRDRIFDPYFSTKDKGTQKGMGLGLTTAYAIVKKHGGYILLDSSVGEGTTFHLYLPAIPRGEEADQQASLRVSGTGSSILTMDDEDMIRDAAARILEHLGYQVESSSSGEEAIEKFLDAKRSGAGFGVVILDLTVRNGMGGAETMRRLKEIDPGVIGIVSSGYADGSVAENYRDFGFSAAVAKPYTAEEIQTTLTRVLRRQGGTS